MKGDDDDDGNALVFFIALAMLLGFVTTKQD
jgi:hypothetical protein